VRLTGFECAQWLHAQGLAAAQVAHLVASLKSYVRPDSAGPSRVNLAESITGVLTMLGHELKPHQLETELDPSLHVHAPPGDLWQIWTNLIQNACDALPPSGRLEITTRAKDHHQVEVAVIDHGPGVPAALRERIFDLNFTTKTGDEHFGLGLGLGITQSLVTQHGGRIWLSDTPGGGATFTVSLPLSQ
jgi:signal transduction histidine kinase